MIWVEKFWDIGCYCVGKTLGIKNMDLVAIKESK